MAIFQPGQISGGQSSGGLTANALLSLISQQRNNQAALSRGLLLQNNNLGTQSQLARIRNDYAIDRMNANDSLIRNRQTDNSQATYNALNAMFPERNPLRGLRFDQIANIPPSTLKTLATTSLTGLPSEDRRRATGLKDLSPDLSPGQRGAAQGEIDAFANNYGGGRVYNGLPVPANAPPMMPPATPSEGMPPAQGTQPAEQEPPSIYTLVRDRNKQAANPQQPANPNVVSGGVSYDAGQQDVDPNAPLLRQGAIKDIAQTKDLQRKQKSVGLDNSLSSDTVDDISGNPVTYRSGAKIPNSIKVDAKTQEYSALQESNDLKGLQKWNQDIAGGVSSLEQTGEVFRTIQDAFLKNPTVTKEARQALDQSRAGFNADFKKYQEIASKQGDDVAREYIPTLTDNLRRGLMRYAQFLPATGQDPALRSSFDRLTGVLALQIAKQLNGGRPSDPDKFGIVQGMGTVMNDPATLFNKQGGMFSFLADQIGPSILATRDSNNINRFNDIYASIVGADYDPRGALYGGVQNSNIRSNFAAFPKPQSQTAQPSNAGTWPYLPGGAGMKQNVWKKDELDDL